MKVLDIVICDDDERQRSMMTSIVQSYIERNQLDMKVAVSTSNPYDVIDYVKSKSAKRLFFLDVDLQAEITGIELASEIRKHSSKDMFVFVTDHPEHMALTFFYKVEALDYISKDNRETLNQRVEECIHLANERLSHKEDTKKIFTIENKGKVIKEEYDNILYFETSSEKRKVILHAKNREVEFYGKLSDIEQMDDCLYRCHRSYVINKHKIKGIDRKTGAIELVDGRICYASLKLMRKLIKEIEINENLV